MPPYPKNHPHDSMEMVLCDSEVCVLLINMYFKNIAFAKSPFAAKLTNILKEVCVYVRTLSNSMYASRMCINGDIQEIIDFRNTLLPEELSPPVTSTNNSGVSASRLEAAFNGWNKVFDSMLCLYGWAPRPRLEAVCSPESHASTSCAAHRSVMFNSIWLRGLAYEILNVDFEKPRSVTLSNWDNYRYSPTQILTGNAKKVSAVRFEHVNSDEEMLETNEEDTILGKYFMPWIFKFKQSQCNGVF
ncbi:uncharacterized protein G2W53_001303 [Senna tora]|uniref:Uncharacterized protein n=1 Tax=Senna tora TaxID=362788 RepID=A0A834XGY2_9FABA|nr:uncharacterized protein G2W53_001303 [Senna tora]